MFLWNANKKKIATMAIMVFSVSFFGVSYWQHHKHLEDQMVANNFQLIISAMATGDLLTVKNQANNLIKFSNRTPYPRLSALFLAKLAVINNNLEEAEHNLSLITKQTNKDQIWHIANLRLIKILLLQNKLNEAEAIKNSMEHNLPKSFISRYQELFGDLLLAKNQPQKANFLYRESVKNLPQQIPTTLIDLKIADTDLEND